MPREFAAYVTAAAATTTEILSAHASLRTHYRLYWDGDGAAGTAVLKHGTTAIGGVVTTAIGVAIPFTEGILPVGVALNITMATASAVAKCRVIYSYMR
jgi:hypothetical protein